MREAGIGQCPVRDVASRSFPEPTGSRGRCGSYEPVCADLRDGARSPLSGRRRAAHHVPPGDRQAPRCGVARVHRRARRCTAGAPGERPPGAPLLDGARRTQSCAPQRVPQRARKLSACAHRLLSGGAGPHRTRPRGHRRATSGEKGPALSPSASQCSISAPAPASAHRMSAHPFGDPLTSTGPHACTNSQIDGSLARRVGEAPRTAQIPVPARTGRTAVRARGPERAVGNH